MGQKGAESDQTTHQKQNDMSSFERREALEDGASRALRCRVAARLRGIGTPPRAERASPLADRSAWTPRRGQARAPGVGSGGWRPARKYTPGHPARKTQKQRARSGPPAAAQAVWRVRMSVITPGSGVFSTPSLPAGFPPLGSAKLNFFVSVWGRQSKPVWSGKALGSGGGGSR
jgi:hypothetical protein|eukprot:COSAG06_NODE_888_length_11767_cov_5.742372_3_plen_174_part_00